MSAVDDLAGLGLRRVGAAVSITDVNGWLQYANDAFVDLFGWSVNDDVHISVITPEDDRPWLARYVARLADGADDEYRTVKRFVRRDGSEFSGAVVVRAIRRNGECVGLVGHVAPAERRDLVDDPRVGKLLEHSASTITLVDEAGTVIETAGRYRTTLGYPPEFWDTRSIFDVLLPDDAAVVLELRDRIMRHPEETITSDVRVIDASGAEQVLEATGVNLLDDPDVRGIVITSRNVTEERATRAQLARVRDQALAEAERRSRLIATVSHELRNPLHALAGLSELLASDPSLDESPRSVAATLHRQVTQMARVTDDLLEHTRLELRGSTPLIVPTRVRDIVDDVVALARAAVGGRPVAVAAVVRADVPATIATDGSRLHQLVWNLVENAVKFTERGRVDVSVAGCTTATGRPAIRIGVSDTGPGVDPADVDRIFEAFHTTAPASGHSGAGLGLAITRRILDLLDATITVESAIGRGSTFTVEVPADAVDDEADGRDTVVAGAADQPVVLVVEDNEVNQQLARHQLDRLQMIPVVVGSAEEAIALLHEQRVDAVLMDHQLPGMNGRDATRELRRQGVDTPVVGITASATAADEQACLDAGMNAFLPKPVGLDQLRATLGALVVPRAAHEHRPTTERVDPSAGPRDAVDPSTLATLAGELGDASLVASLVGTFLGELDQRRHDIMTADRETAARQAHSLKSSARMLGAFTLADACEALEAGRTDASAVNEHAVAAEAAFRRWLDQRTERSRS